MFAKNEPSDRNLLYKNVKTQPARVRLTLVDGTRVEGYLHLAPKLRLIDLLNRHTTENPFLAVTDAKINFPTGEQSLYKFFSVNRAMIVCCLPQNERLPER